MLNQIFLTFIKPIEKCTNIYNTKISAIQFNMRYSYVLTYLVLTYLVHTRVHLFSTHSILEIHDI